MRDYLQHLVARTLSPEAAVRPQLRSAFEPPPVHGGLTPPPDAELETVVEPTVATLLARNEITPWEDGPAREPLNAAPACFPTEEEPPRQVVPPGRPSSIYERMPPLEPEAEDIAPVQPLKPPAHEPFMTRKTLPSVVSGLAEESIPESARAASPPPAHSRANLSPGARQLHPAPTSKATPVRALTVLHQTLESGATRPEQTALQSVPPTASVWEPDPPVASVASAFAKPHSTRAAIQSPTVESEVRPSERSAVAAILPITPAVSAFPPRHAAAEVPTPPAIHVTIGRVEIRAVSPPAVSGAKVAPPQVMSLEEYLGRRTAGGGR